MAEQRLKQSKRLSIITDGLIFILALILVFLIINIFNLDFNIFSNNEYEQLALISSEESVTKNIEQENTYYIRRIKDTYGINVSYGQDTKNYVNKVNANVELNELITNNNLKLLLQSLEKYPIDLFSKINESDYSINIILVDSFNNNNVALASRNNINEYKIYISNNSNFERAFHHEMYHVLEYYMNSIDSNINNAWNLFNPDGFYYNSNIDDLDKDYVYYTNADLDNSYFVSKYSKVSDKEDRAEIFAQAMIMEKKASYLKEGQNIYYKTIYILNNIHKLITNSEIYIDKVVNY